MTYLAELIGLLKAAHCPNCDGSGVIYGHPGHTEYVTRNMAHDAGDLSLEGSIYRQLEPEIDQCEWCARRDALLNPVPTIPQSDS